MIQIKNYHFSRHGDLNEASAFLVAWHLMQRRSGCNSILEWVLQCSSHQVIQLRMWKEEHPGFISVLSSLENQPIDKILERWESKVRNGHIKRITDLDIELPVFEICGNNIVNNYLSFPPGKSTSMRIKMPILVLLVKNLDKYFRFEVTVLDDKNVKRTFISCNNQSITRIKPFECSMPLQLDDGWNEIVFNLEQYCEKAFGSKFVECQKIQVHANCRLARIYFNDKVKSEDEIPADYKLFMRVQSFKC